MTWLVLFAVLFSIVSGKIRYDLSAFAGLLLLGILGLKNPSDLFSGFSSPALFTIITVLIMSAGMVESGILSGLGKGIASRIHKAQNQVFAIYIATSLLSAFMNNVGAIGTVLPTAKRMASRAKVPQSVFGLPIAYASILGGSLTLIGTASNLIISTYRLNAFGEPFKMFDFAYHGLTMILSGIIVVFVCRLCRFGPFANNSLAESNPNMKLADIPLEKPVERSRRKSLIVLVGLIPVIILTSIGILHPSIGFGIVVVIWIALGVLSYHTAISSINLSIIVFLGSMLGISSVLEETGALNSAISLISPVFATLPPFLLILSFVLITALFANLLNNSVSAVLMAPVAVTLWKSGVVPFNYDALLMAVAAGSSLGIIIPSHQATIVVMNSIDFPRKSFIKTGTAIAFMAVVLSTYVIYTIWC